MILTKLNRWFFIYLTITILITAAWSLSLGLICSGVLSLFDFFFIVGQSFRWLFFFSSLIVFLMTIFFLVRNKKYFVFSKFSFLKKVELRINEHHNLLLNLDELSHRHEKNQYSASVIEHLKIKSEKLLKNFSIFRMISKKAFLSAIGFVIVAVLLFVGLNLSIDRYNIFFKRAIFPWDKNLVPFDINFSVVPGDTTILRNSNLKISLETQTDRDEIYFLYYKYQQNENFEEVLLSKGQEGLYQAEIKEIYQPLEYYIVSRFSQSQRYQVAIMDYPRIEKMTLRVIPPLYVGQEPQEYENISGDITSYLGGKIELEFELNKAITKSQLVFSDSSTLPAQISQTAGKVSFDVKKEGSFLQHKGHSKLMYHAKINLIRRLLCSKLFL